MRNLLVLIKAKKMIFMSIFVLLSSLLAVAKDGGSNGGGGNRPESLFKSEIIRTAQEMISLPKSMAEHLTFRPSELLAGAYAAAPRCAHTLEEINTLKNLRKFAYVRAAPEILLNCESDVQEHVTEQWIELLNSLHKQQELSVQSKVLLAHETLRVLGVEEENAYTKSGSIAVALFEIDKLETKQIGEMLQKDESQLEKGECNIQVYYVNSCGSPSDGYKEGKFPLYNLKKFTYGSLGFNHFEELHRTCFLTSGTTSNLKAELLTQTNEKHLDLVKIVRSYGCFKY